MIQIDVGMAVTLMLALLGMIAGFGKVLMSQFEKRSVERQTAADEIRRLDIEARDRELGAIREAVNAERIRISDIAQAVAAFTSQLPLEYVRREDWIRFSATIDTKLDRLHELVLKDKMGGTK